MTGLPLTLEVFATLGALVERRSGLQYRADNLEIFRGKASGRAEQLGFESLLDYYYYIRYDERGPAELDSLVESLLIHETYFFREADQLRALVAPLLASRAAAGGPLRIWCAACSTGEEPYTLAMLFAEAGLLERAVILATDVSERALARARRGDFHPRALRLLPSGVEGRFLTRSGGRMTVVPQLAAAIEWRQVNLLDAAMVTSLGRFDAILVRNVLIYFADDTVRRVLSSLSDALAPRGLLLVGASESLMRYGTSLSCEEHCGAFFYRRIA